MTALIRKLEAAAVEARTQAAQSSGLQRVRLVALADVLRAQGNALSREG